MERSSGKEVRSYDCLSRYYDYLLNDEDAYELWMKYIREKEFSDVLELAAGSAMLSKILKREGHNVIASDISEAMKTASLRNFDGEYLIIDMRDISIDRSFDLIVCAVDSINYLDECDLDKVFSSVYDHLKQGGRFIFDTHSPSRLDEFEDDYIEEGFLDDGTAYQWTIFADDLNGVIDQHFCFYFDDGPLEEHHIQHVFEADTLKTKLESAGFSVRLIPDFIENEKMLVIAEK